MAEIRWRTQAEIDAERTAQAWDALRAERNRRLAACDWTQLPDVSLTTEAKAAWADYRQKLRDLPANTADPFNPVWPVPPNSGSA